MPITSFLGLRRATAVALIAALVAASRAAAQPFTAGGGTVDITPEPAVVNWVTQKPYGSILDPIYAHALVFASGADRIAIISLDLTIANDTATAKLRAATTAATGIPASHILINVSHTHSAPWYPPPVDSFDQRPAGPEYDRWVERVPKACAEATRKADATRRPVTLAIGRANVGAWLFNRRPIRPDGMVQTTLVPTDPDVLPEGQRFGPVDPTATLLTWRDDAGQAVATMLHLACHAVSVYNANRGISADWPGAAVENLKRAIGGEVQFVQGCAGNIVPARRGVSAAREMGVYIAERSARAVAKAAPLPAAPIAVSQAIIGLPLTPVAAAVAKRPTTDAEIQVITMGPLAIVALPGEPLIELSSAIQERSPFPHTLVLGYSNGRGAAYVGMPGHKAKGGYEMTAVGRGTDEGGGMMVETALRLLQEHHFRRGNR